MNPETLNHLDARDLRRSAIHECGHSCVGRHYGAKCSPGVWRTGAPVDSLEKLWVGDTQCERWVLTKAQRRRVALAGWLAGWIEEEGGPEECGSSEPFGDLEYSLGESYEDSDAWSLSDWEGAQGWTDADLRAAFKILKKNWGLLVEEAEGLIQYVTQKEGRAKASNRRRPQGIPLGLEGMFGSRKAL